MPETTNITGEHRRAFEALTSGEAGRSCLFSCFLSGRPAAAIAAVAVSPPAEGAAAPEDMVPTDHDGRQA